MRTPLTSRNGCSPKPPRAARQSSATSTLFSTKHSGSRRAAGFRREPRGEQIAELRKLPNVHYIDVHPNTEVSAWPADTKFVVYRLDVDLRGYENIDVALVTPEGEHRKWFRDVTYDPADGALYGACDAPLAASTFRHEPLIARVLATHSRSGKSTGKRELVAELRVSPK